VKICNLLLILRLRSAKGGLESRSAIEIGGRARGGSLGKVVDLIDLSMHHGRLLRHQRVHLGLQMRLHVLSLGVEGAARVGLI